MTSICVKFPQICKVSGSLGTTATTHAPTVTTKPNHAPVNGGQNQQAP